MLYCPTCGAPIKAGERYCFGCGTKIIPAGQNASLCSPEYCEGCPENNTIRDDEGLRTPGFGNNKYNPREYKRERISGADDREIDYAKNQTGNRREYDDLQESSRRDRMMSDYESQERYRRGEEMASDQPLPPLAVPQEQTPGQISPQQPPVIVQDPAKPKRSFLSYVGTILEILVYLGFIGAAVTAIYLLYQFAGSIPEI